MPHPSCATADERLAAKVRDRFIPALLVVAICVMSPQPSAGQNSDTTFRIEPTRTIAELRSLAAVSRPPIETGTFRAPDLIDLSTLNAPLKLDIRYASANNFMGTPFYEDARAFLQRPAAEALEEVAASLAEQGLGLIVYDAYRPWFVTKMFWEATPDSLKHFVAPPGDGSRHNRGAAVDVGLYNLRTGEPLQMPSGYDEFTRRAYADFQGGPEVALRNRDLLRGAMEHHGFSVYSYEWWHYDYAEWRMYPIMNMRFSEIEDGRTQTP